VSYDGGSTLVDFATGDMTLLGVTLTGLGITHDDGDAMVVTDDELDGPATLPSVAHDDDDGPVTLPSATLVDQTLPSMRRWSEADPDVFPSYAAIFTSVV